MIFLWKYEVKINATSIDLECIQMKVDIDDWKSKLMSENFVSFF